MLTHNLWAGFVCAVHQYVAHILAHKLDYWKYFKVDEQLPRITLFSNTINIFVLGIVFMMGVLFVQLLPKNYFLQLIHAFAWLIFFRLMNQIAEYNNMIQFEHWKAWRYFYIIPVNMLSLAWLKNIIDERKVSVKNEVVR